VSGVSNACDGLLELAVCGQRGVCNCCDGLLGLAVRGKWWM